MRSLIFRTDLHRLGAALLSRKLTGSLWLHPGHPLTLVDIPEPALPSPHHVKVKTRLCGICGTDLQILGVNISRKSSALAFSSKSRNGPLFLGHEVVGEVVEVGDRVTTTAIGQTVTLADDINCSILEGPRCACCKAGNPVLCLRKNEIPDYPDLAGGWSEYFVRHEKQLFSVPNDMPDETAVLLEPMSVGLHAVRRHPPTSGDKILVLGAGVIGLSIVAAIRALNLEGVDVTVSARHPYQGNLATDLGATAVISGGDLFDNLRTSWVRACSGVGTIGSCTMDLTLCTIALESLRLSTPHCGASDHVAASC